MTRDFFTITGTAKVESRRQTVSCVGGPSPRQQTCVTSVIDDDDASSAILDESKQECGASQHHKRDAALQSSHQDTKSVM